MSYYPFDDFTAVNGRLHVCLYCGASARRLGDIVHARNCESLKSVRNTK